MLMLTGGWDLIATIIVLIGLVMALKKKKYLSAGGFALCIVVLIYIIISSPEPFSIL